MRIIYYVEEKETTKLNEHFEYVSSGLIKVRVYEIIENQLKKIHYVQILDEFPLEEELKEDLEWKSIISIDEEIKFVKL